MAPKEGIKKNNFTQVAIGAFLIAVFFQFFVLVNTSYAATITWVASSASTWNTSSSWSTDAVPTSESDVIFSASSTQNVTLNGDVSVDSVTITSGYTGTFTQGTYNLILGNAYSSSSYSQAGGVFAGGSGIMSVFGTFSLTGGTFSAPTVDLVLYGTSNTFDASVFQKSSGGIIVIATTTTITGSSTLNTLQFSPHGTTSQTTITTGTVLTVSHLNLNNTYLSQNELLGGGQINDTGDLDWTEPENTNSALDGGTALIVLDGTGTQTISALPPNLNGGYLPLIGPFTINKPSGVVDFSGDFGFTGNFSNLSNTTINPATSTVVMTATSSVITGSSTFYNLTLDVPRGFPQTSNTTTTISTGTVLTVQNNLGIGGDPTYFNNGGSSYLYFMGGTIDVAGNVVGGGDQYGTNHYYDPGTTAIVLDGTGTQTLNSVTYTSNFTINKPSGSVTLAGYPEFPSVGTWTNLSGTTINPGTSTVIFLGTPSPPSAITTSTLTIAGSSAFYNLNFSGVGFYGNNCYSNAIMTIATGTVLNVTNDLQLNNCGGYLKFIGGGEIDTKGNIVGGSSPVGYQTNLAGDATGTVAFFLNGTGNQIVAPTANDGDNGTTVALPNLTISKSTGTVTFENTTDLDGSFTNTNGYPINPTTSTVEFSMFNTSTIPTITGSSTFYNLLFGSLVYGSDNNFIVATGTTLNVGGEFALLTEGSYIEPDGGGEIDMQGNIGAGYNAYPPPGAGGTVTFVMNGTSTQIIDAGNYVSWPDSLILPDLTIDKSSGVAGVDGLVNPTYNDGPAILGPLTIKQGELQLSAGIVGTGTQEFAVNGPLTVDYGGILSNYPTVSSTLYLGSSLVNNGSVFFDGSGNSCGTSIPSYAFLKSTATGTQIPWSGSGLFTMRYTNVQDQGGSTPITVLNGVNSGDNSASWNFMTGAVPQLVQETSATGGAGTSNLTLSFPNPWPRQGDLILVAISSRNQDIAAPTDTASNTYYLVASSTFNSSPFEGLSLYYAKNVSTTQPFSISVTGTNSAGSQLLSAEALEYTGITSSSSIDTYNINTDTIGPTTSLTSGLAAGQYVSELYFGAATIGTSTSISVTPGSGWTSHGGFANNSGQQGLNIEDQTSVSTLNTAATWTASASTTYSGIIAIFRPPEVNGFLRSGTLDSQTLDTGLAQGAQLNSFVWQGTQPAGTTVEFQFAGSNSATGPWNFEGPDGTSASYFSSPAGVPANVLSNTGGASTYTLFNGYRYFRYRVVLFTDPTYQYTPIVNSVTLNWSP